MFAILRIEDFEIGELPAELEGVDEVLLWDIYDIASKWGIVDARNQCINFSHKLECGEIMQVVVAMTEAPIFTIAMSDNPITLPIMLREMGIIWWDSHLSPSTAKTACEEIYLLAWGKEGMIDRGSCARKQQLRFKEYKPKRQN